MAEIIASKDRVVVRAERYSFYRTPKGTLRYAEHSPEMFHPDKQLCNCTKNVCERPPGDPNSVQQFIYFEQALGRYAFKLSLDYKGFPWFTYRWDGPTTGWKFKHSLMERESGKSQAYFMLDVNGHKGNINVQVDLPGYGRTDCFFGHIYFGNQADISTIMNGHSPSRIVDLKKVPDDQIWAHSCNFGHEAVSPFRKSTETEQWWEVKRAVDAISHSAAAYNQDLASSVDGIRLQVLDDDPMLNRVAMVSDWFVKVLDNLKTTEMFRACDEVYRKTDMRLKELGDGDGH